MQGCWARQTSRGSPLTASRVGPHKSVSFGGSCDHPLPPSLRHSLRHTLPSGPQVLFKYCLEQVTHGSPHPPVAFLFIRPTENPISPWGLRAEARPAQAGCEHDHLAQRSPREGPARSLQRGAPCPWLWRLRRDGRVPAMLLQFHSKQQRHFRSDRVAETLVPHAVGRGGGGRRDTQPRLGHQSHRDFRPPSLRSPKRTARGRRAPAPRRREYAGSENRLGAALGCL